MGQDGSESSLGSRYTLLDEIGAGGLRHPGIVAVRDFVVEGDRLALVMDLVEGGDLRGLLRRRGTLPPGEAARLLAQVAAALAAAHAAGVAHRDVKPGNVLIEAATGPARRPSTDPPTKAVRTPRPVHSPSVTEEPVEDAETPRPPATSPRWQCRSWGRAADGVEMSPCVALVDGVFGGGLESPWVLW